MSSFALKSCLTTACQIYYDYLQEHHLGCEIIPILSAVYGDMGDILLHIKANMLNADSLMLQIDDATPMPLSEEYGFAMNFYDDKRKILSLHCMDVALFETLTATSPTLTLYSDLTFLIKNLYEFFDRHASFAIPNALPIFAHACIATSFAQDSSTSTHSAMPTSNIPSITSNDATPASTANAPSTASTSFTPPSSSTPPSITIAPYLNSEQAHALRDILSKPFSYVWGAPGSGKTKAVLFEALLHYVYVNKAVCVLAPTNSALEQVLQALITKFDTLNMPRSTILRLGTPSALFMESYAEVCDPQILQKKQPQNLFHTTSLKARIKEALIIGLTIDGFIKRYTGLDKEFAHFFLDECAFTPLIKALALTTQNIPITLLGDHKQLMPICEMPESHMLQERAYARLFNLSALFIEEFYSKKDYSITAPIFHTTQSASLSFTHTSLNILRKTHRYGNNLAKILDTHIYHNGLCGNDANTILYYLDTRTFFTSHQASLMQSNSTAHTSQDMCNHAEAIVIAQLFPSLLHHQPSTAIITPFIKQRKLLYEYNISYRHTWTIHGSQGQEFDCVIFSPVKLHYHLTDSRNRHAAYALNVAISRMKKQLILVCDYHYWQQQKGQFLTAILQHATPYLMP